MWIAVTSHPCQIWHFQSFKIVGILVCCGILLYFQFAFPWITVKLNTFLQCLLAIWIFFWSACSSICPCFLSLKFQNLIGSLSYHVPCTHVFCTVYALILAISPRSFFQSINYLFNCVHLLLNLPIELFNFVLILEFESFHLMFLIFSNSIINFYLVFYFLRNIYRYFENFISEWQYLKSLWVFFYCHSFYCCFAFARVPLSSTIHGYFQLCARSDI